MMMIMFDLGLHSRTHHTLPWLPSYYNGMFSVPACPLQWPSVPACPLQWPSVPACPLQWPSVPACPLQWPSVPACPLTCSGRTSLFTTLN